jgi:hypothetical protein
VLEPDDQPTFRRRVRDYGPFTPDGLATAEEILRRFPIPEGAIVPGSPVPNRPDQVLVSMRLSKGLAYRLKTFADMRGISLNRLTGQILAYYMCAVTDSKIKMIHPLYDELLQPEGIKALAKAFALAQEEMGVPVLVRPISHPSDAEFGSDIDDEERTRLQNW